MDFIRPGLSILVKGRIRDGCLDLAKFCHLILVSGSHNDVARYSDKIKRCSRQPSERRHRRTTADAIELGRVNLRFLSRFVK